MHRRVRPSLLIADGQYRSLNRCQSGVRSTCHDPHEQPRHHYSTRVSPAVLVRFHPRFLAYFRNLPPGARLVEEEPLREKQDPDSKGVELYAPSHDYELTGRGRVEGAFDAVLEAYRFCRREDLIHQERAQLSEEDS